MKTTKHKKKNQKHKYIMIISWSEEDNGYGVEIPELPGCFSFGSTMNQAIKNATEAIDLWILTAKEDKEPIPEPLAIKKFSGKFNLRVKPELHRELSIQATKLGKSLNLLINELLQKGIEVN